MKRKNVIIKIALVISLVMTNLVVVSVPSQATTISDLENEKKELERKKKEADEERKKQQAALDAATSKADEINDELEEIEGEIEEVDEELATTLAAIEIMEEEIAAKEEEIAITEAKYEEAKATEETQYEAMKLRIRFMYEKGDYTYMQLLIESSSFSDMMNKAEYIEKLYDYDRRLLLQYQEAKEETLRVKEQLEEEYDELQSDLDNLEEERNYLDELLTQKQEEADNYAVALKAAQEEAAVYKANIKKKNDEIKKLEQDAAAKQKQIDTAREEAARRAAESGGSSSSTAPTGGNKAYSAASSYNSGDKGQDIVAYARQFIGNPYVSGGTSLTNGCDCSGFVMRLYKDFGRSLPRTSTSMRSAGREVSYDEARPGDIVCYAGHVALYAGNGQIIHASTQRTGIKTGQIFYKPVITIRRIFN